MHEKTISFLLEKWVQARADGLRGAAADYLHRVDALRRVSYAPSAHA